MAGFYIIDAANPPASDHDLPAYYVGNRLLANDLEAVAARARASTAQAWEDEIRELIVAGEPGVSIVTDELLERDPEGAIQAVAARIQAGAPMDDDIRDQLVAVTLRTGDPRPWVRLKPGPAVGRARAVQALLGRRDDLRANRQLVSALGAAYPEGANLKPWATALLAWLRNPALAKTCLKLLERTLLKWPGTSTRPVRTSVWPDVVGTLVDLRLFDLALGAIVGPVAEELSLDGASRVLVRCWGVIPPQIRRPEQLERLVELVLDAVDGDNTISTLFDICRRAPGESETLIRRWTQVVGTADPEADPLYDVLRGTPQESIWMMCAVQQAPEEDLEEVIASFKGAPDDAVWLEIERARAGKYHVDPRSRFTALIRLEPGFPALEKGARTLALPAVEAASFPDGDISRVALSMIAVPGRSDVWPYVAITSSEPPDFDLQTLDATVSEFCENPPLSELELDITEVCTRQLGLAESWSAFEHAQWLLRLVLAPDDGNKIHIALAITMVQALTQRPDAVQRLAEVTQAFLELPQQHPGIYYYARHLLPNAWAGGMPRLFIKKVEAGLSKDLMPLWQSMLDKGAR